MKYRISTVKGGTAGTLLECLRWQAEYQGAMADIIAPDGRSCSIDDLDLSVASPDDPYREAGDLTPEEAAAAIAAWFAHEEG